MKTKKLQRLDLRIRDLLQEALEQSRDDLTVWMDADSIAWVLLDNHTIGARKKVRLRLKFLLHRGLVEWCEFDGKIGWRLKKHADDKCCGK